MLKKMEKQKGRKIEHDYKPRKIKVLSDFVRFSLLCIVYTLLYSPTRHVIQLCGLANN